MGSLGNLIATSRTSVSLGVERTIKASGGLRIHGIVASADDGQVHTAEFRDKDSNFLMSLTVPANDTVVMNVPWLADNGIKVYEPNGGDSLFYVTVLHGSLVGTQ